MRDLDGSSDLNALKVSELKDELEARGIYDKKLRLKKDLVDALQAVCFHQVNCLPNFESMSRPWWRRIWAHWHALDKAFFGVDQKGCSYLGTVLMC